MERFQWEVGEPLCHDVRFVSGEDRGLFLLAVFENAFAIAGDRGREGILIDGKRKRAVGCPRLSPPDLRVPPRHCWSTG